MLTLDYTRIVGSSGEVVGLLCSVDQRAVFETDRWSELEPLFVMQFVFLAGGFMALSPSEDLPPSSLLNPLKSF